MVNYDIRPSFIESAKALTQPCSTAEEYDIGLLLTDIEVQHQGSNDECDNSGTWGICTGCGERWPCPTWIFCESLAIQLIGQAAARSWAHAVTIMYPERTIAEDTPDV